VRAPSPTRHRSLLPDTRLLFLLVLTALALAYTAMAFGMDWRVEGGQIGPGFFPRFVGGATVLGCLVAIGRGAPGRRAETPDRKTSDGETSDGETSGGETSEPSAQGQRTDARITVVAIACMALFYVVFETLGAVLASVVFLAVMLSVVNPGRHRPNAAVSVLVPAGLYLLFELLLDAGLPPGVVLPL
jgi:putative tricarboxylic transport membrane protein